MHFELFPEKLLKKVKKTIAKTVFGDMGNSIPQTLIKPVVY